MTISLNPASFVLWWNCLTLTFDSRFCNSNSGHHFHALIFTAALTASLPKLNFFIISRSFVTSTPMLCEGCRNCLIKKVDEARCLWFYCHWLSCKRRLQGKGELIKTPNDILQHQRAGRTHKFGHFLALFLLRIRFGSLQPPDWPSARAWYNLGTWRLVHAKQAASNHIIIFVSSAREVWHSNVTGGGGSKLQLGDTPAIRLSLGPALAVVCHIVIS